MTADRENDRRVGALDGAESALEEAFHELAAQAHAAARDAFQVEQEIDKLAKYILEKVDGEPSKNESAVDTALRVLEALRQSVEKQGATIVGAKKFLRELADDAEMWANLQDRGVPPLAKALQGLHARIEGRLANFRFDGVGDYYAEPACPECGSGISGIHLPDCGRRITRSCPSCGWVEAHLHGHRMGCPHAEAATQSPERPWHNPALKATHDAIVNKARDPWTKIGNAMVQCWAQEDARAAAAPASTPANQCPKCGFLFGHSPDCPFAAREPRVRCSCTNAFMRTVALHDGLFDAKCTSCGVHLTLREVPLEFGMHTRSVRCERCSCKYEPGRREDVMMSYDATRRLWTCRRDDGSGCDAAVCWEVPQ